MSITIACMARNEESRFLARILPIWSTISDNLLVLDDGSTDATREICARAGAYVIDAPSGPVAWGAESAKRAALFDAAWGTTRIGDYILVLDADMIPARDPRTLAESGADGIFFTLYDLWDTSPLTYRDDKFWRGHLTPRLWMLRKYAEKGNWTWAPRGIHCGHFPMGLDLASFLYAPQDYSLLHYAYTSEELRQDKYVQYASVAEHLTTHEREHARSILDPAPQTYPLPFSPEFVL